MNGSWKQTYDRWLSLLPYSVVVSADILFFRHHFAQRLIGNIGIVLVFAAVGFLIFGRGLGRRQG